MDISFITEDGGGGGGGEGVSSTGDRVFFGTSEGGGGHVVFATIANGKTILFEKHNF